MSADDSRIGRCPCCGAPADDIRFLCEAGRPRKYRQHECAKCGYQFTYPAPSAEEIDRYYTEQYFYDSSSNDAGDYKDYDEQTQGMLNVCRDYLRSVGLPRGSRLLDIGCAVGLFMDLAASEFGLACEGIEVSDFARARIQEKFPGRFVVHKTIGEMSLNVAPFDLILMFDVIEHVNSPWDLLWPLFERGCIGPNTRLLITTPNVAFCKSRQDPANWQYRYPPAHLSFCAPQTFAFLAKELQFRNWAINGSFPQLADFDYRAAVADSYWYYDGLFCEFSGSQLGKAAKGCGLDWPTFKASRKYKLLANAYNASLALPVRNVNNDALLVQQFAERDQAVADRDRQLAEQNASHKAETDRLTKKSQELQAEIASLDAKYQTQSSELAEAQALLAKRAAEYQATLSERDQALADCDRQLAELAASHKAETDRLTKKSQELQAGIASLDAKYQTQSSELAEAQALLARRAAEYQAALSERERALAERDRQLAELAASHKTETDRLTKKSQELQAEIASLDAKYQTQSSELAEAQALRAKRAAEYQATLSERDQALADRDRLLAELDASYKSEKVRSENTIQGLTKETKRLGEECNRLSLAVAKSKELLKKREAEFEAALTERERTIATLQTQLQGANSNLDATTSKLVAAQTEIAACQGNIEALRHRLVLLEEKLAVERGGAIEKLDAAQVALHAVIDAQAKQSLLSIVWQRVTKKR